jgi:hypothetical protein
MNKQERDNTIIGMIIFYLFFGMISVIAAGWLHALFYDLPRLSDDTATSIRTYAIFIHNISYAVLLAGVYLKYLVDKRTAEKYRTGAYETENTVIEDRPITLKEQQETVIWGRELKSDRTYFAK